MFKRLMYWGMIVIVLGIIGCSSSDNAINIDYLACNETSGGSMAETETGFFYVVNEILYYADKNDMNKWVAVCNKPDCTHKMGNTSCNAYIENNSFVQQGEQLYGVAVDFSTSHPYIYEVKTDGSGLSRIYDIPVEENIWINSFSAMLSQEQLVFYYKYIEENGMFRRNLVRLKGDSLHTLYTDCVQNDIESVVNVTGHSYWKVRGDDVIISSLLTEDDSNVFLSLWNVDGDTPVRVDIPEDASLLGAYISDDTFRYFKEKEGFYEIDLASGKKTLIYENQLEDSRGYVLTADYMVECNRYVDYTPEEAYLKFYNGEQWLNVELPNEVKNSDDVFSILSVASDRIFVKQSKYTENGECSQIYYFMLNDDNPELVFCDELGEETSLKSEETAEESSEEETSASEVIDIEDIIVFDTDEYFFKITSVEPNHENGFKINVYYENHSDESNYQIRTTIASINGIFGTNGWWCDTEAQTSVNDNLYITGDKVISNYIFEVENIYDRSQYTDVEIYFEVYNNKYKKIDQQIIHIYPYGKDDVIRYEYEIQDTDKVIADNEYFTIIVTGYEEKDILNDTVQFFFMNKSNTPVFFGIDSDIYVNDTEISEPESWHIGAQQCIFASYIIHNLNGITDIKEIKIPVFYVQEDKADENGKIIGKKYFEDSIILNP